MITKEFNHYYDRGMSGSMGPKLRLLVETQLINDLKNYGIDNQNLKFDWSESCIEGHDTEYLDGEVENYSHIKIFDENDNIVVTYGWMNFIHEDDFFISYWYYLEVIINGEVKYEKDIPFIPNHIWEILPEKIKIKYNEKYNSGR